MAISINHYISPEPDTQCMSEKICGKFVNERISEKMNGWHLIPLCTVVRVVKAFSRGSFSNQSHKLWIPRTSYDPGETEGRPRVGPQGSGQQGPQPAPCAQGVQRTGTGTGLGKEQHCVCAFMNSAPRSCCSTFFSLSCLEGLESLTHILEHSEGFCLFREVLPKFKH